MIDRFDPTHTGFDEVVLERWGLKPNAKETLTRAKERGAITPQEITEMVSSALAKDRAKMAEVLQEIKKILQNLNISVTFNIVHTHVIQSPSPAPVAAPVSKVEPKPRDEKPPVPPVATTAKPKPAPQQAGSGHESPFLNAKILQEHGLKPEALGVLLAAKDKGYISPQKIGSLISAEISQDSEKLRPTMRWITQLLGVIEVKIVINEVHYKQPESRSPVTSYSRRPEEAPVSKGKLPAGMFISRGLDEETSKEPSQEDLLTLEKDEEAEVEQDEYADPDGEFIPKFIFDKETGVSNPYYRAVKDHKFLKHEHLLELARRWHIHGDYEARNTIVVHNLRLSMKIAAHYMGRGLDYDDLVQEGNIGLMVAAERFDPEKGFRFTTYAIWWVRQQMQRAIQNFKDIVRMPVHVHEAMHRILKITCELGEQLQREPTLEEVAVAAGEDVDRVKKILYQLKVPVVSLEELAFPSTAGSEMTLGDIIVDKCFPSAVTVLEAKEDLEQASLTIRTLLANVNALPVPEKAKTAFKMYYGLEGHAEGATLESIAQTSGFNVTRERIRQLNAEVWKKLAEHGISMDDEKLVAALTRVHDLEDVVGREADLSPLAEAMVLKEVSSVFHDPDNKNAELVPADSVTITRRPRANWDKVKPGSLVTDDVIRVVAEAYGVILESIFGDSKTKEVVWVRWVCTYILREKLRLSFLMIGQVLHYSAHSVTMHGYRQLMSAMERDPNIKEDIDKLIALCSSQQDKPVDTAQVAESANKATSPIVDHVLTLTSRAFEVEKETLLQRFVRSIDPIRVRAQSARNVAMYVMRNDFRCQTQDIGVLFGFAHYSNVSVICRNVANLAKTDTGLQTKLALIRSRYSLDVYGGKLEEIKRRQKVLFPKQVEELKTIVELVVAPFQEKVRRIHAKIDSLNVPDRHKEIWRLRFAGDPTKETPACEALGQTYGITRERIRQILETTTEQLTPTLDPSEMQLIANYLPEFEKVRLVVELQKL